MSLLPVKIPPGMFRNGTEYESSGRWYDGNMVRWNSGRMKPIGGWQAVLGPGVAFTGVARGGVAWEDNNGFKYIAIGTNSKLYIGEGGVFTDVTPLGLVAGRVDSILGPGYGAGPYGREGYGTQRAVATLELDAATWSFDTFGQDIIGVLTSDQRIFEFNVSAGTIAVVPNSPTAIAVMVTNEDFVLALGAAGNGRLIKWCDVGNDSVWGPLDTNEAGSINLNTGGRCMNGARVGTQNIVWTDTDVHLVNWVGAPAIYAPTRISENCGLVGPNAFAVTDIAYWWSYAGFFTYNGLVQPLDCEVKDYIFGQVNWLQKAKIYGETNSQNTEITWHFPSLGSVENDSYVSFNYEMKIWYFGIKSAFGARTTWIDRGTFPLPFAVDPAGVIYEHETTFLANGVSRTGQIYARSGPVQVGNGDKVIYANLLLPDVDPNPSALALTTFARQAPAGPVTTTGPTSLVTNAEGYVPVRFAGRQVALRLDQAADQDWALGTMRFDVRGGGGR